MNSEKEGFVCPHCRILFALPKGMGGNGAECPGCGSLLTMPSPEDGVLAQGISKVSYQQAGLSSLEISHNEATREGQWNTQRRREIARLENDDKALRWMLPIGLTAILVLGGLGYVLLSADDVAELDREVVEVGFGEEVEEEKKQELELEQGSEKEEEITLFDQQSPEAKKELEDFLIKLHAAKSVDDLLKFCRETKGLREKMVNYYKGEVVNEKQIKELNGTGNYSRIRGFITFNATTTDYSVIDGVIEYRNGEFKLDWESYKAYSEMTWKDLKRLKPTDPVELRLVVRVGHYYNNDFKDERKWQSLALENPHENLEVLHGYVLRDSATKQEVTNFGMSADGYAVTVKAHYPKDASKDDQIIISEMVTDSWIGQVE